ncbi:hypothetical protein INR49_025471 [Caranx melampygus]|nr:hypothetical protein INR49_025471 [Caranx melampygus]
MDPAAEREQGMDHVDNPSSPLVAWKERGKEGRRGDEGGLGKALQIRSNYSSRPAFLSAFLDLVSWPTVADGNSTERKYLPAGEEEDPEPLAVVGSPYWMAPEVLRGEVYNEKVDVFAYGIILCEVIARIQADPDFLPRTEDFGLDVETFQQMVGDCPPDFLDLAISCCNMNAALRPSFSQIVAELERRQAERKQRNEPAVKAVGPLRRRSLCLPSDPRLSRSKSDMLHPDTPASANLAPPTRVNPFSLREDLKGGKIKLFDTPSKSVISLTFTLPPPPYCDDSGSEAESVDQPRRHRRCHSLPCTPPPHLTSAPNTVLTEEDSMSEMNGETNGESEEDRLLGEDEKEVGGRRGSRQAAPVTGPRGGGGGGRGGGANGLHQFSRHTRQHFISLLQILPSSLPVLHPPPTLHRSLFQWLGVGHLKRASVPASPHPFGQQQCGRKSTVGLEHPHANASTATTTATTNNNGYHSPHSDPTASSPFGSSSGHSLDQEEVISCPGCCLAGLRFPSVCLRAPPRRNPYKNLNGDHAASRGLLCPGPKGLPPSPTPTTTTTSLEPGLALPGAQT